VGGFTENIMYIPVKRNVQVKNEDTNEWEEIPLLEDYECPNTESLEKKYKWQTNDYDGWPDNHPILRKISI